KPGQINSAAIKTPTAMPTMPQMTVMMANRRTTTSLYATGGNCVAGIGELCILGCLDRGVLRHPFNRRKLDARSVSVALHGGYVMSAVPRESTYWPARRFDET